MKTLLILLFFVCLLTGCISHSPNQFPFIKVSAVKIDFYGNTKTNCCDSLFSKTIFSELDSLTAVISFDITFYDSSFKFLTKRWLPSYGYSGTKEKLKRGLIYIQSKETKDSIVINPDRYAKFHADTKFILINTETKTSSEFKNASFKSIDTFVKKLNTNHMDTRLDNLKYYPLFLRLPLKNLKKGEYVAIFKLEFASYEVSGSKNFIVE